MEERQQAKNLLRHYFSLCIEKAGGNVEQSMLEEIDSIVDLIIDAAVLTTKKALLESAKKAQERLKDEEQA